MGSQRVGQDWVTNTHLCFSVTCGHRRHALGGWSPVRHSSCWSWALWGCRLICHVQGTRLQAWPPGFPWLYLLRSTHLWMYRCVEFSSILIRWVEASSLSCGCYIGRRLKGTKETPHSTMMLASLSFVLLFFILSTLPAFHPILQFSKRRLCFIVCLLK